MSWIVCGFYTPEYSASAEALRANLDRIGAPHDLQKASKRPGGWEANTRAKAAEIKAGMVRYPDSTIIWIDVDCAVLGTLERLAALACIAGDVGMYVRTRIRRNGKPLFAPRSGTLIIRPTDGARHFIREWSLASDRGHRFSVDQDSLVVALGRVPSLNLTMLPVEACAIASDLCEAPIVLHDTGTKLAKGAGRWRRFFSAVTHIRVEPSNRQGKSEVPPAI